MAHTGKINAPVSVTDEPVKQTQAPVQDPLVKVLAEAKGDPAAIANGIRASGMPVNDPLFQMLHQHLGMSVANQVIEDLRKPTAPKEPVRDTPAPTGDAKASPEIVNAMVPHESPKAPTGKQPLCPAPQVVFDEVGATLAALGFAATGKALPIKAHTAPEMTDTGMKFDDVSVAPNGTETNKGKVDTSYTEGMGKKHATGALANADSVTLNPAGDFTTLIHETVHLYQKGEIGRFLVEPMTDIIAAMTFDRLAGKGIVKGAYAYASEYLPWIVFVKEVLAPKIGWPRLFGYYVGQGMKMFDELAAELGFRPPSKPMQTLKAAFASGDANAAESLRETIKAGPGKNEEARKFDKKGGALDGVDHDMTSFETYLPTFGAVIEKEKHGDETHAQVAHRLMQENKRQVISGAINEAKQHQKGVDPTTPLGLEIAEFIGAYELALTQV